ncbi:Alpha-tubulin suppressor [Paenibacillus sp. cl141a]|uniref:stalk domain-containing protein n=1 Tax=Paenibacillus sp. cl141a TaxID=1761877 RepID=UPI0008BD5400|nr:chromosome condensation regulator RCC1 [Paenibacillus sp. cl141a]SEK96111.1 Alpha-tubulin suppressor [Paenibacillus sp. cl141a]
MKKWNRKVAYMLVTILLAVNCTVLGSAGAAEATNGDSRPIPASVAGGSGHGVASWSDGSVTAWGYNKSGQVGDGTSIHQLVPKQVAGLANIVQVAAGDNSSFALDKNGDVWAWGDYYSPYINGDPLLPFQKRGGLIKLEGLKDVASLAISNHGSVAVHKDGSATIWSPAFDPNDHLKMTVKYFPIKGVTNAKTIVVAGHEALILGKDGSVDMLTVYNSFYDRFRLEREFREVEPLVASSITGIAAHWYDVFLLHENGTVLRWNVNTKQQTPAAVKGLNDIQEIRTGANRLFMLKNDGTVWQWNYNDPTAKPFRVKGLAGITALWGSKGYAGYATNQDGKVLAWGEEKYQGSGSPNENDGNPVRVQPPLSWTVNGQTVSFYGSSAIVKGKLYVPHTSVFEALGIKVKRGQSNPDPKHGNQRIPVWSFSYGGNTVSIKSSDPAVVLVNGMVTRENASVPFLANSTMFPLELITSKLGIPMSWNKTTGEVILGKTP